MDAVAGNYAKRSVIDSAIDRSVACSRDRYGYVRTLERVKFLLPHLLTDEQVKSLVNALDESTADYEMAFEGRHREISKVEPW